MAGDLFAAILAVVALAYVPGYCALRAVRASRLVACAAAPVCSTLIYSVLGIFFQTVGLRVNGRVLVGVALATCAILLVIASLVRKARRTDARPRASVSKSLIGHAPWEGLSGRLSPLRADALTLGGFVAVGAVVGGILFAACLDGGDSFSQAYDNVHHLSRIQVMVDSGTFSSFMDSYYVQPDDAAFDPFDSSVAFYPSTYHVVAAMCASAIGVPVPVACNAVLYVFSFVVYPAAMWLFVRELFRAHLRAVAIAAVVCSGISAFPWALLSWGPVYPNLVSYAMVPIVLFAFVSLFAEGVGARARAARAALVVAGAASVALAQPNGVFAVALVLIPFCAQQAGSFAYRRVRASRGVRIAAAVGAGAAFVAFAVAVWCVAWSMPFMQAVVTYTSKARFSVSEALVASLLISYDTTTPQVVAGVLAIVGCVGLLASRRFAWLAVSYGVTCFALAVNACTDGMLKLLLTGFWYNDAYRIAALLGILAVPAVAWGLFVLTRAVERLASRRRRVAAGGPRPRARKRGAVSAGAVAGVCAALAFALAVYAPSLSAPGVRDAMLPDGEARRWCAPLEGILDLFLMQNMVSNPVDRTLTEQERDFALEAMSLVPEGEIVVNSPNDGSTFLFAAYGDDLIMYRPFAYYEGDDRPESELIRHGLRDVATDGAVRDAVESTGASYVLLLDQGEANGEVRAAFWPWDKEEWRGIEGIVDGTPGFETVLAEGDMRLYRIVA